VDIAPPIGTIEVPMPNSRSTVSSRVPGGGKEELRGSTLKPYVLRLRQERGARALDELHAEAVALPGSLDNEGEWVSVERAARVLRHVVRVLGEDALRRQGAFATHPEALGAHVRMLRAAQTARDAYVYFADNSAESTRVGEWSLTRSEGATLTLTYRRREGLDEDADADEAVDIDIDEEAAGTVAAPLPRTP
jgi:hypothetical protein